MNKPDPKPIRQSPVRKAIKTPEEWKAIREKAWKARRAAAKSAREQGMNDKDREQMCAWLRSPWRGSVAAQCRALADEIERLAARVQKLEQELELALDEKRFAND
jgi:HAMP domain-containing protein